MSEGFLSIATVEMGIVPVDLQTAANTGDWCSLANYNRVAVLLITANFTVIHEKVGTLNAVTTWTRTAQTAATSYTNAAQAEFQSLQIVEFKADELDVDNGFDHIRLDVADVGGNAQLGCAIYIPFEPRYAKALPDSAL